MKTPAHPHAQHLIDRLRLMPADLLAAVEHVAKAEGVPPLASPHLTDEHVALVDKLTAEAEELADERARKGIRQPPTWWDRQNGARITRTRIRHYPRVHGPLPEGVRWVGRPSRWGNPYKVGPNLTAAEAVELYRRHARDCAAADPEWLVPLRDAPALACACDITDPCHADVLLDLLDAADLLDAEEVDR